MRETSENQHNKKPRISEGQPQGFIMPDKLRAIEQLAKICGWNEPEKFEHGASDELTELLKRLRRG
jgi:hypothetical protein